MYNKIQKINFLIILLFIVLFVVILSLSNSIFKRIQLEREIEEFHKLNQLLEEKNNQAIFRHFESNLILVLEKQQKKENKIWESERQLIIVDDTPQNNIFTSNIEVDDTTEDSQVDYINTPNWELWYYYFFK